MVLRALLHLHVGALRVLLVKDRPEQRGEARRDPAASVEAGRRLFAIYEAAHE
jgi:hypothetical protein